MPINLERIKKLRDLGLTEYQARVYLALLDLGSATASQIPTLSRVPRTRIYVTMAQLHEKGLVNIIPERPLKYEPIPISEYMTRMVVELRDDAKSTEKNIMDLADEFSVRGDVEPEQKSQFEAVYGRKNFKDKLKEMFATAEESVVFVGTSNSPIRLTSSLIPVLEDKAKEKLDLRFLFQVTAKNQDKIDKLRKFVKVRHLNENPLLDWAVKDSKEVIVSHPVPNDDNPFKGDDVCIWINNNAMATSMYGLAQEAWSISLDPINFDAGEVMLNSALRWFRLQNFKIDKVKVAKGLAKSIAETVGDELKVNNIDDMVEKLALFWHKNDLGKITKRKKKPLILAIENRIDCQYKLYGGKPHCPFSEYFLKVLLEYKLGLKSNIIVRKCKSAGDKRCEMEIGIDKRSSS